MRGPLHPKLGVAMRLSLSTPTPRVRYMSRGCSGFASYAAWESQAAQEANPPPSKMQLSMKPPPHCMTRRVPATKRLRAVNPHGSRRAGLDTMEPFGSEFGDETVF